MTIQQVIDKIIAYHPPLGDREAITCDTVKFGDTSIPCTGIATAIYPSPDIIRMAAEAGCNLLVVHEPSFYSHMDPLDWLADNQTAHLKMELLREHHMVILRDHDRIHTHIPDGIFYGVVQELGWQQYLKTDLNQPSDPSRVFIAEFEMPGIPVAQLAAQIKEKLQLKQLRIIGNRDTIVHKAALGGHLFPNSGKVISAIEQQQIDLLIPLEMIDWEVPCYFKDAGQLGLNKACLQTGHYNGEELGMKYAVNWLRELTGNTLPVVFCPNQDMYDYI